MKSIDQVMLEVQDKVPALIPHIYLDGQWLWYCGPSLAGKENVEVRQALKDIGFRFAPDGHTLKDADGNLTSTVGSWGHSCEAPRYFRRKKQQQSAEAETTETADAEQLVA